MNNEVTTSDSRTRTDLQYELGPIAPASPITPVTTHRQKLMAR